MLRAVGKDIEPLSKIGKGEYTLLDLLKSAENCLKYKGSLRRSFYFTRKIGMIFRDNLSRSANWDNVYFGLYHENGSCVMQKPFLHKWTGFLWCLPPK